jgi:alpha-tubulin suppressor-like RCC1 family protein
MRNFLTRGVTLLMALTLVAAGATGAEASGRRYVRISASGDHTCALTSLGKAYCWGNNYSGQLGDGTTNASNQNGPRAVIGGRTFSSISAGEGHTCALTASGRAYCWGTNYDGQLGDGTTSPSFQNGPQAVIGGHRFASISAGDYFSCALTSLGKAYCWGTNEGGHLGDGTTNDSNQNGPQAVIGSFAFVRISAGDDHTCALTSRGTAHCWGVNSWGELGDGTTVGSGVNGPQAVIGGLIFASISVSRDGGDAHTCALTALGKAYCWGRNNSGQLGDGTTNDSNQNGPQAVIGGRTFVSIRAGEDFTCALTARGKAYCWGDNAFAQLGDGTAVDSGVNGPQAVIGGRTFASISAGDDHTCALTRRGVAYCWGYNLCGQLGDGTTVDSGVNGPQRVQ